MDQNELYHYGVLGMKWGVRKDRRRSARFKKELKQKHDTKEKKKRLEAERQRQEDAARQRQQMLQRASNDELRMMIERIKMERELDALMAQPKKVNKGAQAVVNLLGRAGSEAVVSAAKKAGPMLAEYYLGKKGIKSSGGKKKDDD